MRCYIKDVRPAFRYLAAHGISAALARPADLQQYLDSLAARYRSTTIRRKSVSLQAVYLALTETGAIPANPAVDLAAPRRRPASRKPPLPTQSATLAPAASTRMRMAGVQPVAALPATWQLTRSFVLFSQAAALQMVGDLAQANAVLDDALIWPQSYPSVFHVRVLAAQCQVRWLAANLPAVLRAAIEFLRTTNRLCLPMVQAFAAELALRQGEVGHAAQSVVQQPIVRADAPAFQFLAPQLVRPKVLLALGQPAARQEAATLLAAAQTFFAETHNTRFLIETLALLAIAHEADQRRADALAALLAALKLAQPGGLVRVFVELGAGLLPLLDALAPRADAPALTNQLRKAIRDAIPPALPLSAPPIAAPEEKVSPAASASIASSNARLTEPLTARKLDVLAAMAQHLTSREISGRLGISANTISTTSATSSADPARHGVCAHDLPVLLLRPPAVLQHDEQRCDPGLGLPLCVDGGGDSVSDQRLAHAGAAPGLIRLSGGHRLAGQDQQSSPHAWLSVMLFFIREVFSLDSNADSRQVEYR